jgi:hypothetical protein
MTTVSSKNIQNQETKVKQVEKPNVNGLRNALRAKYPQSKFQSVYLSKNPLGNEFMVHYASKDIHLPLRRTYTKWNIVNFESASCFTVPPTRNSSSDFGARKRYAILLIINYLWARTCEKRFLVQLETLFTFAAIEKKASKCAVPERMAHLKAISTK